MIPFCAQSSRAFISNQSAANIEHVTKYITPAAANDTFCCELHLGKLDAPVDYSLHFSRKQDGQNKLLHIAANSQSDEQLHNHPIWQAIFAFAKQWQHSADHVWLEFDLDQQFPGEIPLPSVFYFAANPSYQNEELQHAELTHIQQESYSIADHSVSGNIQCQIWEQSACLRQLPKQ